MAHKTRSKKHLNSKKSAATPVNTRGSLGILKLKINNQYLTLKSKVQLTTFRLELF
jgi:hypothetical protein